MLELVSFLCGLSVMILEMAGMRTISPFLGSSFVVWTSVIGVIMASLSFGYWFGGKISDKNPNAIKLSLIVLIAALYIFLVAMFQYEFLDKITFIIKENIYISSVIVGVILFAIPSILLGMVSPYIIKIALKTNEQEKDNRGALIGRFYAISTIGSIIGTFLSGFYLVIYFGIESIFFILAAIVSIAALLLSLFALKNKENLLFKRIVLAFEIIILLFFLLYTYYSVFLPISVYPKMENVVYTKTTPYAFHTVARNNRNTYLIDSIQVIQSIKPIGKEPDEFVSTYHQMFFELFKHKEKKQDTLLIGNGAGVFLSGLLHYIDKTDIEINSVDVVEIDESLLLIAKKFFGLKEDKRINFYIQDGRIFINNEASKKYDLIYFDVYNEMLFLPAHLVTLECFTKTKKMLKKDGVVVINAIGSFKGNMSDYLRQIYTQAKAVFKNVAVYYYKDYKNYKNTEGRLNFMIVATDSDNEFDSDITIKYEDIQKTNQIFRDNFAPMEKFIIRQQKI